MQAARCQWYLVEDMIDPTNICSLRMPTVCFVATATSSLDASYGTIFRPPGKNDTFTARCGGDVSIETENPLVAYGHWL